MQRLEVSGAIRPIYGSLGVKRLTATQCDAEICEGVLTEGGLNWFQILRMSVLLMFETNDELSLVLGQHHGSKGNPALMQSFPYT